MAIVRYALAGACGLLAVFVLARPQPAEANFFSLSPATGLGVEGQTFAGPVAYVGTDGFITSITIDWADGTPPTGGFVSYPAIMGNHAYADEGVYHPHVTVTANVPYLVCNQFGCFQQFYSQTLAIDSTIAVDDAALNPAGTTLTVGSEGGAPVTLQQLFADTNLQGTLADFTALIDWGDHTSSSGTVAFYGGNLWQVTGSHTYAEEGSYSVGVFITDDGHATLSPGATATVLDQQLFATGLSVATAVEGSSSSVSLSFSDGNPNATAADFTVTFVWGDGSTGLGAVTSNGPGWLATASHVYDEGSFPVNVSVRDAGGSSVTAGTNVVIPDAPLFINTMIAPPVIEAQPINVVVRFSDANSAASAADFGATINWGDTTSSAGTVTSDGAGGWLVTGSHAYDEGTYPVNVTITDNGAGAGASGTATVSDAALSAGTLLIGAATEGSPSALTLPFNDANPAAAAADFTAVVDYGGGVTSPGVVTGDGHGGWVLTDNHLFPDEGTYPVRVTITDDGGSATGAAGTATVADGALTAGQMVLGPSTEGLGATALTVPFTDANPKATASDFTATIDYGDGTTVAGNVASDGAGGWLVTGSHAYADETTATAGYPVSVTITDVGGAHTAATGSANVGDAALSAGTLNLSSAIEGAVTSLTFGFTDANPSASITDLTGKIDWGDGTMSNGVIAADGLGRWTLIDKHTYPDEGSYTVTLTITDDGGAATGATGNAQVADAALTVGTPVVDPSVEGGVTAVHLPFMDADPNATVDDFTASINWGDGGTAGSSPGIVMSDGAGGWIVTGSHTYAEEGAYPVILNFSDVGGLTGTATVTAKPADAALTPGALRLTPAFEGSGDVILNLPFTDANKNNSTSDFVAHIQWGDGGASTAVIVTDGRGGGLATDSHTYADEGTYTITVSLFDSGGSHVDATGTATVSDAGLTAISLNLGPATEGTGATTLTLPFLDANPSASATDFKAGINWGDGAVTPGTVTSDGHGGWVLTDQHGYADEGSYAVSVTITDDGGANTGLNGTATVADAALSAGALSLGPATEGGAPTALTLPFQDANPTAAATDFTANIDWGDGALTHGTLAADGHGGWVLTDQHAYADEGAYSVKVTITDDGGSGTGAGGTATVADASLTAGTLAIGTATEGAGATTVSLPFKDANPSAAAADFSATTIDWGDGTTTAGSVAGDGSGGWVVTGSHAYADEGKYAVKVTVSDDGGAGTGAAGTATVGDAAITTGVLRLPAATEGGLRPTTLSLAFKDANPGAAAADFSNSTVDWGDGTTTAPSIASDGAGGWVLSGSHAYADEGNYPVNVMISDDGGAVAAASGNAGVNDAAVTATSLTLSGATEGTGATALTVPFKDGNPGATAADFKAGIDWGDGSGSAGTITSDGHGGWVLADSHAYADEGSYPVTVTVTDDGGATTGLSGTATVADAALAAGAQMAIAATEGQAFSGPVGTVGDANPNAPAADLTATIDWGDGSSSKGTVTGPAGGPFTVSGTHTYAEEGKYPISVAVADDGGQKATLTASAAVADATLTPGADAVISAAEASPISNVVGTFIDANLGANAADFTSTIDWGDGTSTPGGVSGSGGGPYSVSGGHTYAEEGSYKITVAVADAGGSAATLHATAKVSDPSVKAKNGAPISALEFADTGAQVVATFTDPAGAEPNPADPTGTHYAALIDWGDGTVTPGTITGPDASGLFAVSGHHAYQEEGFYTVTSTIQHETAPSVTATTSATITTRNGEIAFARSTGTEDASNTRVNEIGPDGTHLHAVAATAFIDSTPAWSPDGARIAFASTRTGFLHLYAMDADGSHVAQLTTGPYLDGTPTWSPDGKFIAFASNRGGSSHIHLLNLATGAITPVTSGAAFDTYPRWSPDGTRILFTSTRGGNTHIYVVKPGGGAPIALTSGAFFDDGASWSPDGTLIAFSSTRGGLPHIYVMDAAGNVRGALTTGSAVDIQPVWSPDGQLIAFVTNRGGLLHIYTMSSDGTHLTALTSGAALDTFPTWRAAE